MASSDDLERLVARIQQQLAPAAKVTHNAKMKGRLSGRTRQIDVLVSERVGQYEINIVLECKDYSRPVDVKGVEEFIGLFTDVGAQKGVLVCPAGFTAAAKTRADQAQIDLYSPVDTDSHKWQAKVTVPALCDFRSVMIAFGIVMSAPYPLLLRQDFYSSCRVWDPAGGELGHPLNVAGEKWGNGRFPGEVGHHERVPIFDAETTLIDNGYGMRVPVELYADIEVTRDLYFGQLSLARLSGFRDELSGKVITNAFEIGVLDPEEIERDWLRIKTEAEAPIAPVISLAGRISWLSEDA